VVHLRANGVRSLDVTTTIICGRWPPREDPLGRVSLPLEAIFVELGTKSPTHYWLPVVLKSNSPSRAKKKRFCNAQDSRSGCGG
jgi:hypothetical protein